MPTLSGSFHGCRFLGLRFGHVLGPFIVEVFVLIFVSSFRVLLFAFEQGECVDFGVDDVDCPSLIVDSWVDRFEVLPRFQVLIFVL